MPEVPVAWSGSTSPRVGLIGDALQRDDLEQDVGEVGVHVAQQRLLHGGQRGRRDVARAGAAEEALGRVGRRGDVGHPPSLVVRPRATIDSVLWVEQIHPIQLRTWARRAYSARP